MSHTLSRYGEWQDTEWDSNMGRMVPIDRDTGGHQETVSSRQVQVQVPAPFELDGRVYEEKQFNMEQLLLEKEGEMFSFCGLNRGAIRPGAAHVRPCVPCAELSSDGHSLFVCARCLPLTIRCFCGQHLLIKFDICDRELPDVLSGARPACGECVVRLPLTDFVSSNTLHFRELLINHGLPVTDTGLEEDAETGEQVPTKVYADFKIHLVGDGGFHHDMADSFKKARYTPKPGTRAAEAAAAGLGASGGGSARAPTPPRRSRSNSLERYQERPLRQPGDSRQGLRDSGHSRSAAGTHSRSSQGSDSSDGMEYQGPIMGATSAPRIVTDF